MIILKNLRRAFSMKIYTKTGDKGTSALFTGERLPKTHHVFDALGSLDQLSAHLGLSIVHLQKASAPGKYREMLVAIQCKLLDLGSHIATPEDSASEGKKKATAFEGDLLTEELEKEIDSMTEQLPPLKNFILPGGCLSSAQIHVARAVCRRSERSMTALFQQQKISPEALRFVNRLSDYLFTLARAASVHEKAVEQPYQKSKGLLDRPPTKEPSM